MNGPVWAYPVPATTLTGIQTKLILDKGIELCLIDVGHFTHLVLLSGKVRMKPSIKETESLATTRYYDRSLQVRI